MADQPPDDGPGNRSRTPLDNRSTSQENGCGETGDNYPAHNMPNVGRSLISILRSREFNSFIIT